MDGREPLKRTRDGVYVVGYAHTEVKSRIHESFLDLAGQVSIGAVSASGLPKEEIQGLLITQEGYGNYVNAQITGARLACQMRLETRFLGTFDCGGMSAAMAVKIAATEIMTGRIDTCLVVGVEKKAEPLGDPVFDRSALVDRNAGTFGPLESLYSLNGPLPLPFYAMSQQRWMAKYGLRSEDIAHLPVLLRQNASRNPIAQFRQPISLNDVLFSKIICPPIRLLECCARSEGAAAVVLASRKVATELQGKRVKIRGFGEAHDSSHFFPERGDAARFPSVERSAREAYEDAGIRPEDLNVAEIYGAFAGTELMVYEEMGFFEGGRAPYAVQAGETRIDGRLAVNPSGGRLSLGHPTGATPLFEMIEICTQLREEAKERQIKNPVLGLVQAEHGMVNGSIVLILEREA